MARWLSLVICIVLLSGCWDRREIEDVGFIVGVAVDMAKMSETQASSSSPAPDGKTLYTITFQFVSPAGTQQSAGGSSGGAQVGYWNFTSQGESMSEVVKYIAARSLRIPFFEHLKAVLISEDVAKSAGFREIFDFFIRYPEIRRNTRVFIVKGDAKAGLVSAPPDMKLPAFYIDKIIVNMEKSSRVIPKTQIGDIHESMLSEQSFTALYLVTGNSDVSIVGNAVFSSRDYRMAGLLDGDDVEGRNLITGEYHSGPIKVKIRDSIAAFNIRKATSAVRLEDSNPEKLRFTIHIKTEGDITEALEAVDFSQQNMLRELESAIEEEIIRLADNTVMKCQNEYRTDVIGIGEYLTKKHPRLWKKIEKDWEAGREYFKNSEIIIKPEVSIRSSGIINESRQP